MGELPWPGSPGHHTVARRAGLSQRGGGWVQGGDLWEGASKLTPLSSAED